MDATAIPSDPGGQPIPAALSDQGQRLAEAAVDLFYRQGALATTVRQITRACGLTPGALYNHFSSKEELLYTVVRDIHLRLEASVAGAQAGAAGDPVAELMAIVRVYVDRHAHHKRDARVANREYTLLTGEWRSEVVAIRRRLRDRLAGVLMDGQARSLFNLVGGDDRASATLMAATILDMCIHVSEWFHESKPLATAELQDRYAAMALRLTGAPESP
ncbi:MAG: TetR/AcrR family transcriptional regulator [Streptosporangiaceae bacterium]